MLFMREAAPNTFEPVVRDVRTDAVTVPFGNLPLMSDKELAAVGVYRVEEPVAPEGKIITARTYERQNGVVVCVPTLEDAPPPPVPFSVTDRQFAQALAETGVITWPEAQAWGSRGDIPPMLADKVAQIPDELTRDRAVMFLGAAQSFERYHPVTLMLLATAGWTADQADSVWRLAGSL